MLMKGVTLRGLEVFEALAKSGSVAQAADVTGLSQPAVSQQLRNLEKALGSDLVDHRRRPMVLTAAGHNFLTRTRAILSELRLAQSELTVMDLSHLPALSLGLIDDFDHDLTPRLATILADNLTQCRFRMVTASSHEINRAVASKELNMGIAAATETLQTNLTEYPLVEDPFIIVTPRGMIADQDNLSAQLAHLPLMRYAQDQLIAQQIEAQLTRNSLIFDDRFQIGSHQALMAMVARRIGWAITTPLGYMRAERYHDALDVFPLPFAPFSRRISLFADPDWPNTVPLEVTSTMRSLIQSHVIDPVVTRLPWLGETLHVLDQ